jgi:ribosomal protein L27
MAYAAGFSWELDGNEALGDSTAGSATDSSNGRNENTFIDLYFTKDTFVSISSDHIPNSDVTLTNLVGWGYLGAQGVNNATSIYPTTFNDSGYGIGIVSNLGPATLSIGYQPNPGKAGGSSDTGHNIKLAEDSSANSKVEATLRGDLGVKGLDVLVSAAWQDAAASTSGSNSIADANGRRLAAKYNFGQVTVAGDYIRYAGQNLTQAGGNATATGNHTLVGKSAAIAYAITPAFSIGYTRSIAETNQAGNVDEKVNMFAAGYNLGAVVLQAQHRDGEGIAGQTGDTGKGQVTSVMISTKF